eukprot:jgi/Picre1/30452/NNA_005816.t1
MEAAALLTTAARRGTAQGIGVRSFAFFISLSQHLATTSNPVDTRKLSGLVLKNALDSRDSAKKDEQASRWMGLPENVRLQTKESLLVALEAPEMDIGHTSALVIAKVAAIEIPKNQWPQLVPKVLTNADQGAPLNVRQSSIEVLGYLCEELAEFEEDYLDEEMVNKILTGVVTAMRPEEPSMDLRCVATKALTNALDYASGNFQRDQERNYIMETICHGTGAADAKVREAAWECLVRVVENYYEHLPAYIGAIFTLTQTAMGDPVEGVVMQALEFWSSIAEEEFMCLLDVEDGKEDKSYKFILNSLNQLVPLLLEQLTKQDEFADEGSWNIALAAGTALSLTATVAKDPIVGLVMPYVEQNIHRNATQDDWKFREAATFAFGCILDGPDCQALGGLARSGLNYLLSALSDGHPLVKNTTAWCLGRIFEFVHGHLKDPPLITPENLPVVIEALLKSLDDEIHIAEKVCYAISKLAAGFSDMSPSPLSQYFETIVGKLLATSTRVGEQFSNIQIQSFEAINEVVTASSQDALPIVAHLIPVVNQRIAEVSSIPPTSQESSEQQIETLNLLCGVLNVIITKMYNCSSESQQLISSQVADSIMQALLTVFSCRQSYVPEEAMLAVGALTYITGGAFQRYMESFYPFLEKGLRQVRDWQTCLITLGILGDVCRALDKQFSVYCDPVMTILIQNLEDPEVPKSVKPSILSSFGDISIAIGDDFVKYLKAVAAPLGAAAAMSVEMARTVGDDEDEIAYINSLRQHILEAWSGILNALSKEMIDEHLKMYAPMIIEYVEHIAHDPHKDLSVLNRATGALGDVAANVSEIGIIFKQKAYVKPFLEECMAQPGLDEKANWALTMVRAAEQ